jgi:hypothetical protein
MKLGTVKDNPVAYTSILIALALAVVGLIVWTGTKYDILKFVPASYDLIVDTLTPIFLIALLVERALQVFLATGREIGRADTDQRLNEARTLAAQIRERIALIQGQLNAPGAAHFTQADRDRIAQRLAAETADLENADRDVASLIAELDGFRAETARITFVVGASIGLVIALAGVRVLTPILDLTRIEWPSFQRFCFHGIDVVLTAGLIAGGANGIHQIIGVFSDFTESTRKKVKA